ncbi:MAG: hypothetical protein Q4C42_05225 [Clostridia bacterium]|nr:hypothetical protein [Clostridia bacterium]
MAYKVYIDTILVPVPPDKISTRMKNRTQTIELVNNEIYTNLKGPDLSEISFDILLPVRKYHFANYTTNKYTTSKSFKDPSWFISRWQALMENKRPCRLYIVREVGKVAKTAPMFLTVIIDQMDIEEEATENGDFRVSMSFKRYDDKATKKLTFTNGNQYKIEVQRNIFTTEIIDYYTVKQNTSNGGRILLTLAKKYNLSKMTTEEAAKKIFSANKTLIIKKLRAKYDKYKMDEFKTVDEAKIKKKYGEKKILELHARPEYISLLHINNANCYKNKWWKDYTYLVKGTDLKIPLDLMGAKI